MLTKLITAIAGQSVARTVGGAAAGPAGAIIGGALPILLPAVARRLGPLGMVAAAVGGVLFTRWMERRRAKLEATAGMPPRTPEAVLGGPTPPDALEGELLRDRL